MSRNSISTCRTRSGRTRSSRWAFERPAILAGYTEPGSIRDRRASIRRCRSTTSRRSRAACAIEEAPLAFRGAAAEPVRRASRFCSRRSACTACWPRRSRAGRVRSAFAPRSAPIRAGWLPDVMAEGLIVSIAAVAIGMVAAWALARSFSGVLFGVSGNTGITLAAAAVILIVMAAAASIVPARRASRVDPVTALRND